MAFCRILFPLLVLSVVSGTESIVPVYLWGESLHKVESNPLSSVTEEGFQEILQNEIAANPQVVVFKEKTLSVEDFSLKQADGKTSYPYLQQNVAKAIYLPSVKNALATLYEVATLNDMESQDSVTNFELTQDGLSGEVPASSNFVFIDLNDAAGGEESRMSFLHRHDEFMREMVAKLSKTRSVVAIYTAEFPSWTIPNHRVRREVTANQSSTLSLNGLRLYAASISLKSRNETTVLPAPSADSPTEFNNTVMNTKLLFENSTSLTLNFNMKGGYWFFDSVILSIDSLTEVLLPSGDEVFAIEGFSYRCAQNVKFASQNQTKDYTLNFENLKIQPFFEPTNGTTQFGDSLNCVGFFSAPIWTGLFVVFIMLLITFYGIMMMLDIRTMDRFDDPKGKTITINTGE